MLLTNLGLFMSFCCISWLVSSGSVKFLIYLTNWCLLIHTATLLRLRFRKTRSELDRVLLIISWTLGWVVSLMFWLYIYPILGARIGNIPLWFNILSHGGVHSVIAFEFIKSQIEIQFPDFKYPFSVCMAYLFGLVLPLKQFGIIIYPMFFDEVLPTVAVLIGALLISFLSFYSGTWFKTSRAKET
jgi:hypothetical protein